MDQKTPDARLGRRLLILRVTGLGAAAATPMAAEAAGRGPAPHAPARPVEPARTDSDPSDSAGYGHRGGGGRTDNDPRDTPGYGRGYAAGGYAPQRRSVTDNDPNDGQGQGRGYAPARRSVTDSDPRDGQGQGRGWR